MSWLLGDTRNFCRLTDQGMCDPKSTGATPVTKLSEQIQSEINELTVSRVGQALFDDCPDALVLTDLSGVVLAVNQAFERLTGFSGAETRHTPLKELTPPEWHTLDERVLSTQVAARGYSDEYQKECLRSGGTRVPVSVRSWPQKAENNELIGIWYNMRDITEMKAAEEVIKHQDQQLRQLVDAAKFAVIRWSADGRIRSFNEYAQHFFGYRQDEVLGKSLIGTILPEIDSHGLSAQELLNEIVRQPDAHAPCEHEGKCREGRRVWMNWTHAPIDSPDGDVKEIISVGMNITERKAAEEAMKKASMELARSNQDLEQFAYAVSHDLQEPLRMISSYLDLLEEDLLENAQLGDDARAFLHYALDGASRMQKLISDLLAYSRVGRAENAAKPVNMNKIVRQAIHDLGPLIEEAGAVVSFKQLPTILGDASQVEQLFLNLIGNAVKFRGEKPPRITIQAQRLEDKVQSESAVENRPLSAPCWLFRVNDNGIGIAPESQERVFTIFQRLHTRDEYAGTGLGLAVCKKIVARHGGRIWVESREGGGASFCFTIPDNG